MRKKQRQANKNKSSVTNIITEPMEAPPDSGGASFFRKIPIES